MPDNPLLVGTPEQDLVPSWLGALQRRFANEPEVNDPSREPDIGMIINPTRRTKDLNEIPDDLDASSGTLLMVPHTFPHNTLHPTSGTDALMGYGGQVLMGLQRPGAGGVPREATDPALHPEYRQNPLVPQAQPRRLQLPDGSSVILTPVDHNPFAGAGT